jgi:hypothetical protein
MEALIGGVLRKARRGYERTAEEPRELIVSEDQTARGGFREEHARRQVPEDRLEESALRLQAREQRIVRHPDLLSRESSRMDRKVAS